MSSEGKSSAGSKSSPTRSRIVLPYSVRLGGRRDPAGVERRVGIDAVERGLDQLDERLPLLGIERRLGVLGGHLVGVERLQDALPGLPVGADGRFGGEFREVQLGLGLGDGAVALEAVLGQEGLDGAAVGVLRGGLRLQGSVPQEQQQAGNGETRPQAVSPAL